MGRNAKYSYSFKLRCVQTVLKEHTSIKSLAKEQGCSASDLRLWVGFYQTYGKAGLKPRQNQRYDTAFKLRVLKAIERESLSLRTACVQFNISRHSVISDWKRAYESNGLSGLTNQPRGRPKKMKRPIKRKSRKSNKALSREEELLRENEYLKAENELLKKLQALAQTKKKQKP
jgi:transposase